MNPFSRQSDIEKPAFDPNLHDRIMQRVQQARVKGIAAPQRDYRPAGYAAAVSIALTVGISILIIKNSQRPEPAQFVPLLASLKESTEPIHRQLTEPIEQVNVQMTLLRDDAIGLGQFVRGQFDVLPRENRTLNKSL